MTNYEPGYPKSMVHPQHAPSQLRTLSNGDVQGTAMRYPPETVANAMDEAQLRSKGYLEVGEALTVTAYQEYPLMMTHPEHVDDIPPRIEAHSVNGVIQTFTVPGVPGKFPAVFPANHEQENEWLLKGYRRAGHGDAKAFDHAIEAPGMPGTEWPKWVNGVYMEDPDTPVVTNEYPKWVHPPNGVAVIVNSRQEEEGLIGPVARGSSKNEPAKQPEKAPAVDPELWAKFEAFMAFERAQKSPPEMPQPETSPPDTNEAPPADTRPALLEQARELGIEADKRWGTKRLQDAIDRALAA